MPPFMMGRGALVKVQLRFLHPYDITRPRNYRNIKYVVGTVVRKGVERIMDKEQSVLYIHTENELVNQPQALLYACERFFTGITEGPEEGFFVRDNIERLDDVEAEQEPLPDDDVQVIQNRNENRNGDVFQIANDIEIDDDNAPAPENIDQQNNDGRCRLNNFWGRDGICNRRARGGISDSPAVLLNAPAEPMDLLGLFETFLPKQFIEQVVLANVNNGNDVNEAVTYGEFLRFLGINFLIATIEGPTRRDFWSSDEISHFSGAPFRVDKYMSRYRFENILYNLKFTNSPVPAADRPDKFFPIRDMVKAFNANMKDKFESSWINCLDESMMEWSNKYTCPGFMYVPRKPHPFGNEWHTICCADSGIMYGVEIVEGKDRPEHMPQKWIEMGKTVSLLLRMCESIFYRGKVVILDSGFCVLAGIMALLGFGVYASAMIKKRRYWPKYIPGDRFQEHFADRAVGDVDAISGTFDRLPFDIICMKDVDWVTPLMTTYGTTQRIGEDKFRKVNGRRVSFKYPEVVYHHYKYRHAVDDHNSRRHYPISLERSWGSKFWPERVFTFLLAVVEINVLLADRYFYKSATLATISFRKKLAEALIYNKYFMAELSNDVAGARRFEAVVGEGRHLFKSLPKNKKFRVDEMVDSEGHYPQRKCSGCQRKVRSYCSCSPGFYRCVNCYGKHCLGVGVLNEE